MKKLIGSLILVLPLVAGAQEDMLLSQYIARLAEAHDIEVTGLQLTGNDRLVPERSFKSVDRSLARALHRYNYIVNYGGDRVTRVIILGRRGTSVGELPPEYNEPAVAESETQ